MTEKKIRSGFAYWMVLPLMGVMTFILTKAADDNPAFVEKYYSEGIYPSIASCISKISSVVPFSADDIFYIFLFIIIFGLIVLTLFKKIKAGWTVKLILNIIAIVYTLFYSLWGFNYFRTDLYDRLEMKKSVPEEIKFEEALNDLISVTNETYTSFSAIQKEEIDSLIEVTYKKLAPALKIDYPGGRRRVKEITFSRFFARAVITGYYGPFFNEIHINKYALPVEYPFVLAHEKAHQFGITSEAEANFYSWIVCTESGSEYLQYSANLAVLRYFLGQTPNGEKYRKLIGDIDSNVINDLRKIRSHWRNLRNVKVDRAATRVNDAYLKSNKVEKGIEDYTGIVKFVVDYSVDNNFREKLENLISLKIKPVN